MANKTPLKKRKNYGNFMQSDETTENASKKFKNDKNFGAKIGNKIETLSESSDSDGPHSSHVNDSSDEQSVSIGKKLMSKMGYREGTGLGKHEQGNVNVIPQSKQKGRRGLGYQLSDIIVDPQFEWSAQNEKQYVYVEEDVQWIPHCEKQLPNSEELQEWAKEGPKKMTIDDENEFCDDEVLRGVLLCKNVFDCLSGDELRKSRSLSNPFETIEKGIFQNRAAMKMANMDTVFDYMFTNPVDEFGKPLLRITDLLYFADLCAGPGGFSEYVLWRKKWHAKGFGFTLKGPNDFKLDEFFAGSSETFEPHYGVDGPDGDGDIFKPHNLIAFRDFVIRNTEGLGVHFVMADGGFSVEGQENIQEILSKRLYLCQFLCALAILRPNGSFVCKLFDVFTKFSVGLIYLMYRSFHKITIHKPNTSRPANSERYVICKWKRNGTTPIEDYLFKLNCQLDLIANKKSSDDIIEVVPNDVIVDDSEFFKFICESNAQIGRRQILFLSKVKAFVENQNLMEMKHAELRKQCLKYWDIPMKPRVAPSRTDALSKFKELISKNNGVSDYFAHKSTILTYDNLNALSYPNGFKCMVLGSENTDLFGTTNINFGSFRGFFLGLGRQNIHYWDGSSSSKWTKIEAKLELPPETLIYAEQVQELKGEGKGQRRMSAIHIIDALFIGGDDVREKCFEERISLANKMAKAVTKTTQTEYAPIRVKRVYDLVNVEQLFNNMDMKECKGAQRVRLCYEIDNNRDNNRFMIPYGMLIINTIKPPWIVKLSRNNNKLYYFNMKKGKSQFELPNEAIPDFHHCFSGRILWKLDSDADLIKESIDNDNKANVTRIDFEKFIEKKMNE